MLENHNQLYLDIWEDLCLILIHAEIAIATGTESAISRLSARNR